MSVLTPERKKEILLMAIEAMREKVEGHMIGDMSIDIEEKITSIYATGSPEPVSIMSMGFRYTLDVTYLDPVYTDVPDSAEAN